MLAKIVLSLLSCGVLAGAAELAASSVQVINPGPFPMMKRAEVNPVFAIKLTAENTGTPGNVTFTIHPADSISEVTLRTGDSKGLNFSNSLVLGTARPDKDGNVTITSTEEITSGENWLWVHATPSEKSRVGGVVEFRDIRTAGSPQDTKSTSIKQRIGYMVAVPGEEVSQNSGKPRACTAFRIPGLITTRKGTLIGCFDARYDHERDLCADIDVAVVRSSDGGQTWTTPDVAMDAGPGPTNGCGDPCILQDKKGRIWLQALAAHFGGGAVLGASKAGQGEDVTGQWIMTYSNNEGKTWAKKFINPTRKIKEDEWTCILAGPGRGIVTSKGIIVFPAQIWQNNAPKGTPRCRSTICYSKDGGRNWAFGEGLPHSTSECQVVELQDGSLMLNARNEARNGKRAVYVTNDLGETWEAHPTNLNTLQEPVCQASIISVENKTHGNLLLFSNPKSGGRNHMTIRVSKDDGQTWSKGYEYDRRDCMGYSCLTQIDDQNIGVIYEVAHKLDGARGIGFLRFPLDSIITETTEDAGADATPSAETAAPDQNGDSADTPQNTTPKSSKKKKTSRKPKTKSPE